MLSVSTVGNPAFKIGIDGGGTKTEFILTDATGKVIDQRSAPGCSPSIITPAAIHAIVSTNLQALGGAARQTHPAATITNTLFCMAGSRSFWSEFAAAITGFGRVQTFDDSFPVLELATNGKAGLVLHSGTGSFVAARSPDGTTHFAGGLGWRLGDPASAYDLGQHAIARAILELQGWAVPSALGAGICQATDLHDANALTRHFYADPKAASLISTFAPHVTRLAAAGDEVAREILCASVAKLAELANEVIARSFGGNTNSRLPVGLSGAILRGLAVKDTLTTHLDLRCELHEITEAPIEGVRRLLARLPS